MRAANTLKSVPRTIFMSKVEVPSGARKFEITCSSCNLRELCLPGLLCAEDMARAENLVYARRRVKRGEFLFNAGAEFNAVYAIRSGFFKTSLVDGEGREQVTGFSMGGELIGLEGIGSGAYHGSAIALEDSEVCILPFTLIEEMARDIPALQRQLHAVLSREIVRDHGVMMLLGSMRAEERLATFLINLSKRFVRRGYSASDFHLRMTREEIGSYLGLKLETVSRLFSRFQTDALIEVEQKHVRILDIAGLERVLAGN
jgi:CRP/FNR family transcriptional regulator, anaerobic regulatory protein